VKAYVHCGRALQKKACFSEVYTKSFEEHYDMQIISYGVRLASDWL
jgi:hypothetical protein